MGNAVNHLQTGMCLSCWQQEGNRLHVFGCCHDVVAVCFGHRRHWQVFISYVAVAACQRQWNQIEAGRPSIECYPSSTGANGTTFGLRKCRPGLNICPSHQRRSLTHTSMQEATYIDSWFSQHCLPCNHFLQLATGLHASREKIFHRIYQSFLKVIVLRLS